MAEPISKRTCCLHLDSTAGRCCGHTLLPVSACTPCLTRSQLLSWYEEGQSASTQSLAPKAQPAFSPTVPALAPLWMFSAQLSFLDTHLHLRASNPNFDHMPQATIKNRGVIFVGLISFPQSPHFTEETLCSYCHVTVTSTQLGQLQEEGLLCLVAPREFSPLFGLMHLSWTSWRHDRQGGKREERENGCCR